MSAVYVSDGVDVRVLGITEQLVGVGWLHEAYFRYAGNVGPVEVPEATELALTAFGQAVARSAGLVGLFGVDFQYAAGVTYPVEINPRYPASAEVIEFATGRAVMLDHAAACGERPGSQQLREPRVGRTIGKAVYYAPWRFNFPNAGPWDEPDRPFDPWVMPAFADVPDPGSPIPPGWPVLTMFEGGSTTAEVRRRLQSRSRGLDREFDMTEEGDP
jgi:predicted ATP-grasp superfamily ATP-dependent carboligase